MVYLRIYFEAKTMNIVTNTTFYDDIQDDYYICFGFVVVVN